MTKPTREFPLHVLISLLNDAVLLATLDEVLDAASFIAGRDVQLFEMAQAMDEKFQFDSYVLSQTELTDAHKQVARTLVDLRKKEIAPNKFTMDDVDVVIDRFMKQTGCKSGYTIEARSEPMSDDVADMELENSIDTIMRKYPHLKFERFDPNADSPTDE